MSEDWKTRMKRYEQELLQMRAGSRLAAEPPPSSPPPAVPKPPVPARTTLLHVTVLSADGTPLEGAMVWVDKRTPRGREAMYVRMTDRTGVVEPLPLPVSQADTLFDIGAAANGYYREAHHGVAVMGKLPPYTLMLSPLPEL